MKKILPLIVANMFVLVSHGQLLMNELYPEPANNKSEFFELYNTSVSGLPQSTDNYTLVSFFESPSEKGFCVMDLPNLSVRPKGFFVGSAALPFNYQGVSNSTASDFSWNSAAFTSNNGYVKKWKLANNNLSDGNLSYDEVPLPANFNDFFQRRTAVGSTYTVFLYKNGILVNAVCFGTGGTADVLPSIIAMPPLFIDMSGTAPDFTIDFSTYGSKPVESVSQDAGTDNGYIRERDGLCGGWDKSSSQVQHTPKLSNGNVDGTLGTVSATAIIVKGTAQTGSSFIYDVVAASASSFPIELQAYKDNGPTLLSLDSADEYVESNFETVLTDGPFTTIFTPYDMNMLLVIKTNAGCIDKVLYAVNSGVLPLKLISFNAAWSGDKTNLEWRIANNESAKNFEVQTSTDGSNFTTISTVAGTTTQGEVFYQYPAVNRARKNYYRLKIVGIDQTVTYSRIVSVDAVGGKNSLTVLQNPAIDALKIRINSIMQQPASVKVYDMAGRIQSEQKITISEGSNYISLPNTSRLNSGSYVVEVACNNEKLVQKFIKR